MGTLGTCEPENSGRRNRTLAITTLDRPLDRNAAGPPYGGIALSLLAVLALAVTFRDGLLLMTGAWSTQEYSHGYLIPVVAIYLIWLKAPALRAAPRDGAWAGLLVAAAGLAIGLVGELSTIYTVIQYGFVIALYGVVMAWVGWAGLRLIWVPLLYLLFMVPLPAFLYFNLSADMQLVSSSLGVWFIRLFGIPVFLEGNVIDLGVYKLQVVEACSGLRYLFPLMSFGFLVAYLYQGPFWHKALVFLSTGPITIVMNSLRIGIIGWLVEHSGIAAAEGFLHLFEGWVIFLACLAILAAELWLLRRLTGGGPLAGAFALDWPKALPGAAVLQALVPPRAFLLTVALMTLGAAGSVAVSARVDAVPARQSLAGFPLAFETWEGQRGRLDQIFVKSLKLDDFLMANYWRRDETTPVNLYVAYYASQRKGEAVHSPRACIPGDGWEIQSLSPKQLDVAGGPGDPLRVNRVVIAKGQNRQLVYYWFEQRGRNLTNEYLVKWYLFWDGLTRNRTDGALVRVVTRLERGATIEAADERLTAFVRDLYPRMSLYVPG